MVKFNQLLEEIRQNTRKYGRTGSGTEPCGGRVLDQCAHHHLMAVHYAGPVSREIECGNMQRTGELR